jgi:hypothetical protein
MDLVMVFLALCLIAWMRGKLTARPLSFGQWAQAGSLAAPDDGNAGRACPAARIRCQSCRRSLRWSSAPTLAWDAAR